ncbi:hypothetical protein [Streptomyces sp. NPDC059611]
MGEEVAEAVACEWHFALADIQVERNGAMCAYGGRERRPERSR